MRPSLAPEYVEVQLQFAHRFVQLGLAELPMAVLELTNLHRRLGLGDPDDETTSPDWERYISGLVTRRSIADQVVWTLDFAATPMSGDSAPRRDAVRAGPFSAHVHDGVLRTHFTPKPSGGVSPLHASQRSLRRQELRAVIDTSVARDPGIRIVRGVSWLYNTRSYRSLFPREHVATATLESGTTRFQGSSSWGQFLDHRGGVKANLRDQFLRALETFDGSEPAALFPLPALTVESPIETFTADWDDG